MKPKVSIIVLTMNRLEKLKRCIESAQKQTYSHIEIIVVDNFSNDGTREYLDTLNKTVKVIKLDKNTAIEGFNIGMKNATGDYFAMFDDDCIIPEEWTSKVIESFSHEPGSTYIIHTRVIEKGLVASTKRRYMASFCGSGCMLKRKVFDTIGGYPKEFFIYANEADLGVRVVNRGFKILYDPTISWYHDKPYRTQTFTVFGHFHQYRNGLWLVWKYYPWYLIPLESLGKIISSFYQCLKNRHPLLFFKIIFSACKGIPYCLRNRELAKELPYMTVWEALTGNDRVMRQ